MEPARTYLVLDDDDLLAQCVVDVYRASGPGGQKRNKTCSAVRLRHAPTGLVANAVEERSQHANKRHALRRLRRTIALQVRHDIDLDSYQPSTVLATYINDSEQLRVNAHNPEFALVVAEVLDVVVTCRTRISDAANLLGLSTAHLVQFLGREPRVWGRVNELRRAAGEKPLR